MTVTVSQPISKEYKMVSSIGGGGTSAFLNMMEQFDRMGVRAHFSI